MAEATSPPKKKRRSQGTPQSEEEEDEGFKFTRQSRRAKANYYQGKRKSATKSARKKRRSSFVRGRKERKSLPPPPPQNSLHQSIPIGLPPTARIRMLFNKSLELAITKITEEPSSTNSDHPDFQEEAKAVFDHLRQVISETDIIDEACQSSSLDQNVEIKPNHVLEKSAVSCKLVSQRLQEEDSQWDELLHSYQQSEDKIKQELREYEDPNRSKEECPDFLSPSQHKLLSGKPGFKNVLDKLDNVKQNSQLQVDKICQVTSNLKNYKDFAESYVQQQTKSFGAKSLQVIIDMGTPRTLIRGRLTRH